MFCPITTGHLLVIRLSELKLPLSALPVQERRASDAPAETDDDRKLAPHPIAELRRLAALALGIGESNISALTVFKRSFDARKQNLLVVYIVDISVSDAALEKDRKSTRLNSSHT